MEGLGICPPSLHYRLESQQGVRDPVRLAEFVAHTFKGQDLVFQKMVCTRECIKHRCTWGVMYGLSDVGPSACTTHQGTHAGQGMRNTGLVWGIENMVYMMLGHGSQDTGLQIQQWDRLPGHRRTLSISVCQFSPLTKACLFFFFFFFASSSVSFDAKEWECPGRVGPRVPPTTLRAQTGVRAWSQDHGSERACQAPRSLLWEGAVSANVGWARAE